MFDIIPLVLILLSLVVIITIVVKKFSVLAVLDVDSIPAEREIKFKEQIISKRLQRNFIKYYAKLARLFRPISEGGSNFFKWFYNKLIEFKENYNEEEALEKNREHTLEQLFIDAEELIKKGDLAKAEKKLIDIISYDSKNIQAFQSLGRLYFNRRDYEESKQTLEHSIRLLETEFENAARPGQDNNGQEALVDEINNQLAKAYFDLALTWHELDNLVEALNIINKALTIEPNNPRYLDTKLEISIINKDKIAALDAYTILAEVNPENQKLADLKRQVELL